MNQRKRAESLIVKVTVSFERLNPDSSAVTDTTDTLTHYRRRVARRSSALSTAGELFAHILHEFSVTKLP